MKHRIILIYYILIIILFSRQISKAQGQDCVVFNFESAVSEILENGIECSSHFSEPWQQGSYLLIDKEPPQEKSTQFITPGTGGCGRTIQNLRVHNGGILECRVYLEANEGNGLVRVLLQDSDTDTIIGEEFINSETTADGWHTITINVPEDFEYAHIILIGNVSPSSILLVDYIQYAQDFEGLESCIIYTDIEESSSEEVSDIESQSEEDESNQIEPESQTEEETEEGDTDEVATGSQTEEETEEGDTDEIGTDSQTEEETEEGDTDETGPESRTEEETEEGDTDEIGPVSQTEEETEEGDTDEIGPVSQTEEETEEGDTDETGPESQTDEETEEGDTDEIGPVSRTEEETEEADTDEIEPESETEEETEEDNTNPDTSEATEETQESEESNERPIITPPVEESFWNPWRIAGVTVLSVLIFLSFGVLFYRLGKRRARKQMPPFTPIYFDDLEVPKSILVPRVHNVFSSHPNHYGEKQTHFH